MSVTVEKCIGVVDGGMLILEELQTVTLEGVRVPRVGIAGGSAMRTVLQRCAQDQLISYEITGRDRMGYPSITAKAGDVDLTLLINQALKDYGYTT
ncbi:MAG: hypothetical protein CMK43_08515 [Porticoccaceae bacterium]|nr:hypothetical protein [Porticoccaceae bacterium]|tara:strand:+ start:66 stop:353 length:288 start_codon:yes stop_codon:yes gene_type:complete